MKFGRPWNVEGVRPRARETARFAARRSGVTVGEWLDSVIIERAAEEGIGPPWSQDDGDRTRGDLAAINDRLADLTNQLDRIERSGGGSPPDDRPGEGSRRQLGDAISRLDQRLGHAIHEGRLAASEIERHATSIDQALTNLGRARLHGAYLAPASLPPTEPRAADDIAHQRASDSRSVPGGLERPQRTYDVDRLEQQLRQIGRQIDSIARPCQANAAAETLSADLSDLKGIITAAIPSRAVEAMEKEIRSLVERLEADRNRAISPAAFGGLERGLAEVRDELRRSAPAERLAGFDQAVQGLSRKVDSIAASLPDSRSLQRIDEAIAAVGSMVSQLASSDALASVAKDVQQLAQKLERIGPTGDNVAVSLDARIAAIADALESHRREHDRAAAESDKAERIPGSSDSPASAQLENRIAQLVDKLNASEARLTHLGSIERGLAELVAHLERIRARNGQAADTAQSTMSGSDDESAEVSEHQQGVPNQTQALIGRRGEDTVEKVQGAVSDVVSRRATVESDLRQAAPNFAPTRVRPEQTSASPPPLAANEDGRSNAPNARYPASRDPPPNSGVRARSADQLEQSGQPEWLSGKTNLAVAGRSRAQTKAVREPVAEITSSLSSAFARPFAGRMTRFDPAPADEARSSLPMPLAPTRQPIDSTLPPNTPLEPGTGKQRLGAVKGSRIVAPIEEARTDGQSIPRADFIAAARRAAQAAAGGRDDEATRDSTRPETAGKTLAQRMKAFFFAGFLVVILVGLARLGYPVVLSQLGTGIDRGGPVQPITVSPNSFDPESGRKVARESSTQPTLSSPASSRGSSLMAAADPKPSSSVASQRDATGGLTQGDVTRATTALPASDIAQTVSPSPPTVAANAPEVDRGAAISSASQLYAALSVGNPAAAYEMGSRFAEGRGVVLNFQQAALWFDRAAKAGSVPGLFRLAALYENGQGVGKDLQEARRLYLAAAGKGHAKAMHNLAVLYVQAIDGKPDYVTAAHWFQKAAYYGVADSQYNLGVLFSRGIGVTQNLAEGYKWFALAAARGDRDAANKRDEVAARLDAQSLLAARLAVQAFAAETQPADVMTNPEPPGGWDRVRSDVSVKVTPAPRVTAPQPKVIL
jgi:localization factor PodJL